jgi:hypothetical protein
MPRTKNDLQVRQPPRGSGDGKPRYNVVHAEVGGWQARFRWPSRPKRQPPPAIEASADKPRRRWAAVLALSIVVFALGVVLALGTAWELVPYVETTRVVGELARFKPGGALCLTGGILLYMVRKFFRR